MAGLPTVPPRRGGVVPLWPVSCCCRSPAILLWPVSRPCHGVVAGPGALHRSWRREGQTEMSQQSDSRPPRRFQFSLATLFVVFTIAAVLIAGWAASRRLDDAAAEIQKYRNEVGQLTIADRQRVHAIGVRVTGRLEWKWRVYLPENRRFQLRLVTGGVPQRGTPEPGESLGSSMPFQGSGEFLVLAKVEKDYRGEWGLAANTPDFVVFSPIPSFDWLQRGGWGASEIGPGGTNSVEPGQPMVLLRARIGQQPPTPCDGLMVLIEEIEAK